MMEMATCHVCGKIHGSTSGGACQGCRKLLDVVYEKARAYLRDHPKEKLHAAELAKAINEDERLIEILIVEGRFDSNNSGGDEDDESVKRTKKLLEDIQKNLTTHGKKGGEGRAATTYGADRYGRAKDK